MSTSDVTRIWPLLTCFRDGSHSGNFMQDLRAFQILYKYKRRRDWISIYINFDFLRHVNLNSRTTLKCLCHPLGFYIFVIPGTFWEEMQYIIFSEKDFIFMDFFAVEVTVTFYTVVGHWMLLGKATYWPLSSMILILVLRRPIQATSIGVCVVLWEWLTICCS